VQASGGRAHRGQPDGVVRDAAGRAFVVAGWAYRHHLDIEAQGHAGQRVVAIEHDMRGVDLGDRVDGIGRHACGLRALGQAVELHALFDAVRKQCAVLEAHQLGVVVAKGVLGFEVQGRLEPGLLPLKRLFELGQQIVAAEEELHRLVKLVYGLALGVGQGPHQADDTGVGDQHRGMIAYPEHNPSGHRSSAVVPLYFRCLCH
jgi:hypothetical protein